MGPPNLLLSLEEAARTSANAFVNDWRNALRVIPLFGHTEIGVLNSKYYVSAWIDQAANILLSLGNPANVDGRAFIGAAVACGVQHNMLAVPARNPIVSGEVIQLGLMGQNTGRRADPLAWQETPASCPAGRRHRIRVFPQQICLARGFMVAAALLGLVVLGSARRLL
jgi:hypothetical protein